MDYITISEMAEKWNISERMIRRYCIDGRIEGTIFEDNAWLIPEDAQKPLRKKKEAPELPILVKKLQRQRTKKIYHGLYDYIQTKSIGHGITCTADLVNEVEVFKVMLELAQDVGHRLRVHELAARGVQISPIRSICFFWTFFGCRNGTICVGLRR